MDNSEDLTFDIPLLGKITQSQVEQFLPFYVRLRKDPEFKAMIPKEMDQKIMAFAELKGLAKPKRKSLEDIDTPLSEIHEAIDYLTDEGYSVTQIAKQLNIYTAVVTNRCIEREKQQEIEEKQRESKPEAKSGSTKPTGIKAWLKRRL
jgi:hypothetical protein